MSFMQREIDLDLWAEIDGSCGITALPASLIAWPQGMNASAIRHGASFDCEDPQWEELCEAVADYSEGSKEHITSIEIRKGYGARLSAPGYLDCTEWSVFDTEEEAQAYLEEQYPEEEGEA